MRAYSKVLRVFSIFFLFLFPFTLLCFYLVQFNPARISFTPLYTSLKKRFHSRFMSLYIWFSFLPPYSSSFAPYFSHAPLVIHSFCSIEPFRNPQDFAILIFFFDFYSNATAEYLSRTLLQNIYVVALALVMPVRRRGWCERVACALIGSLSP